MRSNNTPARADIPVLVYHRIGTAPAGSRHPDTYVDSRALTRQLTVLKALGYRTVSAEQYEKSQRGIPCRLPSKPVLLTFDDGSSTVYSEALPILKSYGFSAVVFMVSSLMGQPAGWDAETAESGHRQLTAEELRALSREGWSVGSHTATHARLPDLGFQALQEELLESKKALEALVGQEVDWFAYPYGNFDERTTEAVSRAGYRIAFATEEGNGFPFSIPRRVISGRTGILRFLRRLLQARRMSRR